MSSLKTAALLALMTALLVAVGGAFAGRGGMMIMLIISLGINFVSYWFSDKIVLKMYNAQEVSMQQAPELVGLVAKLARKANMPMPRVYVIDMDAPNAFATGRNPENAAVAATRGILRMLTLEELEGVMAHELAHVKNRDTLISTIAASLAGVITMIADMVRWGAIFGMGRSNDDDGEGAGGLVGSLAMMIVAPLAAMLIQMGISRSREYLADRTGGELSGNPLALASALSKMEMFARGTYQPDTNATPATAHMFIVNPLAGKGQWLMSLFSTHPTTASRIEELKKQAELMRYRK
ncbi:zinc metalloprotease HtpX [Succinispira mobilis]|uniref:zinc metalloprotease HtpX n=1 Tax=Succinispira mobilis TaxID=78120 RepID=UPI00036921A5|nr:zinc metalloprotease HtpX [Succinispira mobilis]